MSPRQEQRQARLQEEIRYEAGLRHGGRDMTPLEWIMVGLVAAALFSLTFAAWKMTNHE